MTSVAARETGLFWRAWWRVGAFFGRGRVRRVLLRGEEEAVKAVKQELERPGGGRVKVLVSESAWSERGGCGSIAEEAARLGADEVIVCAGEAEMDEVVAAAGALSASGIDVRLAGKRLGKAAGEIPGGRGFTGGYPSVRLAGGERWKRGARVKRVIDIVGALTGMAVMAPVWAILGVVMLLVEGGPVFFRQERVGSGGKRFWMYKFRTMRRESEWPSRRELRSLNTRRGPMFKAAADPRVTRMGRWLRSLCIDETPQLVNVLRGEMSLVGARPPLPDEVELYSQWHHERLAGPVGMTGLWQISEREKLDFDDVVFLDFYYNRNRSVLLDLRILAETLGGIVSGRVKS